MDVPAYPDVCLGVGSIPIFESYVARYRFIKYDELVSELGCRDLQCCHHDPVSSTIAIVFPDIALMVECEPGLFCLWATGFILGHEIRQCFHFGINRPVVLSVIFQTFANLLMIQFRFTCPYVQSKYLIKLLMREKEEGEEDPPPLNVRIRERSVGIPQSVLPSTNP